MIGHREEIANKARLGLIEAAERRLAPFGLKSGWPRPTSDVLRIVNHLGLACSPKLIDDAVNRSGVKRPAKKGREYRWGPQNVVELVAELERRRAFIPTHHPETLAEISDQARRLEDSLAKCGLLDASRARHDYLTLRPDQLVAEMVDAESVELRAWAVQAFRIRLGLMLDPPDRLLAEALDRIAAEADTATREALALPLLTAVRKTEEIARPVITVSAMLEGLRDSDPEVRGAAAYLLALSSGTGLRLAGADELDVEHGAGADLAELLKRAIDGDTSAVDALEKVLTTDQSKASTTPRESSPTVTKKGVS